jgi:simple sugar transport system ATP-binding protein
MDVDVRNLTKVFGLLRANDRISLHFAGGKIHGVLGENGAGKSTLMKILAGLLRRDEGEILIGGRSQQINGPADALKAGIGMVYQEPLDVPAFSVAENFYCASPPAAMPSRVAARRTLAILADRLGFVLPPDAPVHALTVGQRQQLEIVRLLACGAQVFILDEPTTGISAAQIRALFAALRQLASEGKTVLFVSHKLNEVVELCDTVSVLRAGRVVGEQMAMPVPKARMLALMFGQDYSLQGETVAAVVAHEQAAQGASIWRLEHVAARDGALTLSDVSLHFEPGTITGVAGLEGSGQHLLLRLLGGRMHPSGGRILVRNADMTGAPLRAFLDAGIQYLPADRLHDGMIGAMSLTDHFAIQNGRTALIDRKAAQQAASAAIARYAIKGTPNSPIASLSGGNQQRAMLALLPDQCSGILLEHPTRGLDIASADTIWELLRERCAGGTAIVFASSELDELLRYSDRVVVFYGGRVSPPLPRADVSEQRLAELIGGVGFETLSAEKEPV